MQWYTIEYCAAESNPNLYIIIDYAISRYRSRIHRPCNITAPRDQTILCPDQIHSNSYTNAHRPARCLFDKQCRMAIIISLTVTAKPRIDSQSVTGHRHAIQHMQITLQHKLQFHVTTVASDTVLFY